jgi:hypothetical protein
VLCPPFDVRKTRRPYVPAVERTLLDMPSFFDLKRLDRCAKEGETTEALAARIERDRVARKRKDAEIAEYCAKYDVDRARSCAAKLDAWQSLLDHRPFPFRAWTPIVAPPCALPRRKP